MYYFSLICFAFSLLSFSSGSNAHDLSGRSLHDAHRRLEKGHDLTPLLRRQACSGTNKPCGSGCISSDQTCCDDGRYCRAGYVCWLGDSCCHPGDVVCGTENDCMPPTAVCCSNDGYYCDQGETCFVTAAGTRPKCCRAGQTCSGASTFFPAGVTVTGVPASAASTTSRSNSSVSISSPRSAVTTTSAAIISPSTSSSRPTTSVLSTTSMTSAVMSSTTSAAVSSRASTTSQFTQAFTAPTSSASASSIASSFTGAAVRAKELPTSFVADAVALLGIAVANWILL